MGLFDDVVGKVKAAAGGSGAVGGGGGAAAGGRGAASGGEGAAAGMTAVLPPAQPSTAQPPASCQHSSWCRAPHASQRSATLPCRSGKRHTGHGRPASAVPIPTRLMRRTAV